MKNGDDITFIGKHGKNVEQELEESFIAKESFQALKLLVISAYFGGLHIMLKPLLLRLGEVKNDVKISTFHKAKLMVRSNYFCDVGYQIKVILLLGK